MDIEKLRIKTTLKTGSKVWGEGTIVCSPIPPDLVSEVRSNTGTVEVLSPDPSAKKKEEIKQEKNVGIKQEKNVSTKIKIRSID